jgi:hypothetical protein
MRTNAARVSFSPSPHAIIVAAWTDSPAPVLGSVGMLVEKGKGVII